MTRDQKRLGPYSKRLHRGAIGDIADGRSATGRFIRHLEAELTAHVGGSPTITQRLTISRIIRLQLQMDAFAAKLQDGAWTTQDSRIYGALLNAHRLGLRELGLKAAAAQPVDPMEAIRARLGAKPATAA
jgi:hypothetical protein